MAKNYSTKTMAQMLITTTTQLLITVGQQIFQQMSKLIQTALNSHSQVKIASMIPLA